MRWLILGLFLYMQVGSPAGAVIPPKPVQELLEPILDLRVDAGASTGERQNEAFRKSEELVARLLRSKTRASDEALAALMNFYVGESLQVDLVHEVTSRGKRMLSLLEKYRSRAVRFSDRNYPTSIWLSEDTRNENFNAAIKNIKAGKATED